MSHDEQLQIRIPGEPAPQPNEDPSFRCCSLRSSIIGTTLCFAILAGVIAFYVWIFTLPGLSVYVESAALTSFNLSSPNTLHHNLSVELSISNPSSPDDSYYIQVEISAYYEGKRFQRAPLDDFMGNQSITMLRAVMAGTTTVDLGASGLEQYKKQSKAGAFDLEVKLDWMEWYEDWSEYEDEYIWKWMIGSYRCFLAELRLHATDGFVRTKCHTGGWFSDIRDRLGLSPISVRI